MPPQARDPVERFREKVGPPTEEGCWPWAGFLHPSGYGMFYRGRVEGRARGCRAHRFAYETFVGPIPEGLTIDHLCRNRWCVNPEHLEPVTNGENVLRGVGPPAENARKTHCDNGHLYDEKNTKYELYRGKTIRRCRKCRAAISRRRYWEAKARAALSAKARDEAISLVEGTL
jgi:hypothetical protein